MDPYRLWNYGKDPLPPHPRPRVYRNLLYAMAYWLEDLDRGKLKLQMEGFGAEVTMDSLLDSITENG